MTAAVAPPLTAPRLVNGYGAMIAALTPRPETPRRQVADVLTATTELLITEGWCQGDPAGQDGHCLQSAILTVCWRDFPHEEARRVHADVMAWVTDELANRRWFDFAEGWNDLPTTTVDDVLDMLAAARAAVSDARTETQR